MKRDNFTPTNCSKLCGNHFKTEDFSTSGWSSLRVLKPDAVPSVFRFPPHLTKLSKGRKAPRKRSPKSQKEENGSDEHQLPQPSGSANFLLDELRTDEIEISRKRKSYVGDFEVEDMTSTVKAAKFMEVVRTTLTKKNKSMKSMRLKEARLQKRVRDLQGLVKHLREKSLISDEASDALLASMPNEVQELFKRLLNGPSRKKYPESLRSFVLTLNFYSAKAYSYVRRLFRNVLPHPRTLQKWYQVVNGGPGFTNEAIVTLEAKVLDNRAKGKETICALMLDEMCIRKKVEWSSGKFSGFINFGSDIDSDGVAEAKDALVMMVNSINDSWKIPVGYFLIDSLGSEERANLVQTCLEILNQAGVVVPSLTFDGASANMSMASCLGADLRGLPGRPWFPHPVTGDKVFIILDPSHMLKLVRNALATCKTFINQDGGIVKWAFVEHLVNIQEMEGLHLGTKCNRRHLMWEKEKMRVKTAAQTLSRSVSKGLQYLRESNYSQCMAGSGPTEEFLLIFNDAFDILNSRNLLGRGFKGGITQSNSAHVFQRCSDIIQYIHDLKDSSGSPILHSSRRTGFLGFLTAVTNVKTIFEIMVENRGLLKYLLPYKLSQDHLEVFFSAIRSRGGHNNNPTALQFAAAYKRLLIHAEINGSLAANCTEQFPTTVLSVSSARRPIIMSTNAHFSLEDVHHDEEDLISTTPDDHDYCLPPDMLTKYVRDIISYIAGFVLKQVFKYVKCETCLQSLTCEHPTKFLHIKQFNPGSRKGLIKASEDVINICKVAEKTFRLHESSIFFQKNVQEWLVTKAMEGVVGTTIFKSLRNHMFDEVAMGNHVLNLIKCIMMEYFKVRLHHKAEVWNMEEQLPRLRSILTKTILFRNQ